MYKLAMVISATTVCVLAATASAQAATISVGPYLLGGTQILIRGQIVPGDEQQFRAVADTVSADVVVVSLSSPGGSVAPAIAIGRMVRARGFMTLVGRAGFCASACTLIWLSGKHAVVQRNAYLGFHAAAVNGQFSAEGTAYVASYLRELGLTPAQIQYAVGTPQPLIRVATERDAMALDIHPQVISSLFGIWRSCQAKFCLAIP
jgi:hypothetical protein